MFENEKQLEFFLQLKVEFENLHIDIESSVEDNNQKTILNQNTENSDEHEVQLEVLQLKDNVIPRGLVPLEALFDFSVAQKPKMQHVGAKVEDCNIGTKDNLIIVKISKSLLQEEKNKHIGLLKK